MTSILIGEAEGYGRQTQGRGGQGETEGEKEMMCYKQRKTEGFQQPQDPRKGA